MTIEKPDEWKIEEKGKGCLPTLLRIVFTRPRNRSENGLQSDYTPLDEEDLLDKFRDGYSPFVKRF